ncbi:DUF2399 domain-containing protein [Blastococcus sp. PRF04-17]|uniref:DUF2399 domain-containing protein n=1 Tax=Blastococcus sp. PRF04-17 TaxID=2933797 RepID=UPI001FF32A3A|nr:DUF2399 domain-containing protein [Blastococcus sp. PRF04-17]UOY03710.1 DUF2399 domain-containing protein [Blastococcus sp. PRF04-17]
MTGCRFCADRCNGAELGPLLIDELHWLWTAVAAAADRRGDADLATGRLQVATPLAPNSRAAAVGLLGGARLRAGQRRTVDMAALTTRLRVRGPRLTPGAVAAHAVGRRLAVRATEKRARNQLLVTVRENLEQRLAGLPGHVRNRVDPAAAWERLRTTGWAARLAGQPDPFGLVAQATAVLAALPPDGQRSDRRTLVPTRPHALDEGRTLAGLVLALAGLSGVRARAAWDVLGVDCDDLTGGLHALGIHPAGWTLPADAVVTVPPRELDRCIWPAPPQPGAWVFVTENPSVVAAAAGLAAGGAQVRLLGTSGTPSAREIVTIAALPATGWRVAVRADFDAAGLAHVRAILAACPQAVPWRMSAADYMASDPTPDDTGRVLAAAADTPWDPALAEVITTTGAPAYEEALLDKLLDDLALGHPSA